MSKIQISMKVILVALAVIVMIAIKQWFLLIGFLIGLASSIREGVVKK